MTRTLLDAGPLAAYFSRADGWHEWSVAQMRQLTPPLWTCEPVLTEACFVIARNGGQAADVIRKVQEGILSVVMDLETEAAALEALMLRYADVPMSLADACLVRLTELHQDCRVFTLDRDFARYRRHGRQVIPMLAPW
jgi:predicted nucleic acid-binding protein